MIACVSPGLTTIPARNSRLRPLRTIRHVFRTRFRTSEPLERGPQAHLGSGGGRPQEHRGMQAARADHADVPRTKWWDLEAVESVQSACEFVGDEAKARSLRSTLSWVAHCNAMKLMQMWIFIRRVFDVISLVSVCTGYSGSTNGFGLFSKFGTS